MKHAILSSQASLFEMGTSLKGNSYLPSGIINYTYERETNVTRNIRSIPLRNGDFS